MTQIPLSWLVGSTDNITETKLKRRRAIRSGLATLLALPPSLWLLMEPSLLPRNIVWPLWKELAFLAFLGSSLLIGWKPAVESWKDHDTYVDEPDVGDGWQE